MAVDGLPLYALSLSSFCSDSLLTLPPFITSMNSTCLDFRSWEYLSYSKVTVGPSMVLCTFNPSIDRKVQGQPDLYGEFLPSQNHSNNNNDDDDDIATTYPPAFPGPRRSLISSFFTRASYCHLTCTDLISVKIKVSVNLLTL